MVIPGGINIPLVDFSSMNYKTTIIWFSPQTDTAAMIVGQVLAVRNKIFPGCNGSMQHSTFLRVFTARANFVEIKMRKRH
jgi:hypothetical protein